jgi:hypothetical protein
LQLEIGLQCHFFLSFVLRTFYVAYGVHHPQVELTPSGSPSAEHIFVHQILLGETEPQEVLRLQALTGILMLHPAEMTV